MLRSVPLTQAQYAVEGFEYAERVTLRKVGRAIRIPTNALVAAQGLPGSLPWGVLLTYLNDFLAEDQGLSVGVATSVCKALNGLDFTVVAVWPILAASRIFVTAVAAY